jgi:hypothetical protein
MARRDMAQLGTFRPTQLTAGMAEVREKKDLARLDRPGMKSFMEEHPIPAVVGPGGRFFIIDHHHLGRAALEANVEAWLVEVEADLSTFAGGAFWKEMDRQAHSRRGGGGGP